MTRRSRPSLAPRSARWGLVALVAGGILVASVVDPPLSGVTGSGSPGPIGLDKRLHAAAYGGLAAALAGAVGSRTVERGGPGLPPTLAFALAVALATGYGLGVELLQWTLPYRSFDPADAAANAVGALIGAVGSLAVARRRARSPD